MDRRQFIQLMESKSSHDKESITLLQDFIVRFPYCQTGHLLLAKCLHDQQNILFDQQLKTAAAYVADRKVLYELIHNQEHRTGENAKPVFRESPVFPFSSTVFKEEENSFSMMTPETENVFIETPTNENIFKENFPGPEMGRPEGNGTHESIGLKEGVYSNTEEYQDLVSTNDDSFVDGRQEKILDPHEVIRRRLSEILSAREPLDLKTTLSVTKDEINDADKIKDSDRKSADNKLTEESQPVIKINEAREISNEALNPMQSVEDEIISIGLKNVRDVVDKIGLEHAMEESIIHSIEKFPLINKESAQIKGAKPLALIHAEIDTETGMHSFYGWLQIKAGNDFGKMEEVHDDLPDSSPAEHENIEFQGKLQSNATKEELISQFLAAEPRIIPSKAEFYSPVNQAKKSISDNEDIVSETLAKIYFSQGNLLKARSSFKKLSLLHPEKSNYFAALIQEIDNLLNKQE